MDIDSCEDGEECIFRTIADTHLMRTIVIQYTVIDPLRTAQYCDRQYPEPDNRNISRRFET